MPSSPPTTATLFSVLRGRRVATAQALAETLCISQPTISRLLAQAGDEIVKIGRARRSRYAMTRDVRGLGNRWPLYRINAKGQPEDVGHLVALHRGGTLLETTQLPDWLRGEFVDGLFPGLPWFLDDMRPQGFLGRMFARAHAFELGLGGDILRWSDDEVLAALLLRGDDGPGQFILGDRALERALSAVPAPLPAQARADRYASLADAALTGSDVGSSAAGEQPKFTACIESGDGHLRHVIVKFSEPVDSSPVARRWADLLVCEHLASVLLAEHDLISARSELIWSHGRLCLESTRFDRIGAHGRRGVVSLAAWSDAHDGVRDNWPDAVARMHREGWLTADNVVQVGQLWWFGQLIGNTDMHFGNLSFFLDSALPLSLCPSYDMLPMFYRPGASGNVPTQVHQPKPPAPALLALWQRAALWATAFWQRVAEYPDISADFRALAEDNRHHIERLRERFG